MMSSPFLELPILIIGGGIAGLSLACTLHQRNVPFEVVESLAQDHSTGYGISLLPWAWEPLLDALGKDAHELQRKTSTDSPVGGTGYIDTCAYNGYNGQKLLDLGEKNLKHGAFRANRVLLRRFFLEGLPESKIHFETTLKSFKREDDGSILATFTNGTTVRGKLLVAADGVKSTVRNLLHPSIKPTYTTATVFSSELHLTKSTYDTQIAPHMHSSNVTVGFGDNFMIGAHNVLITKDSASIGWTYSYPSETSNDSTDPMIALAPLSRADIKDQVIALGPVLSKLYSTLLSGPMLEKSTLHDWPMRSVRTPLPDLLSSLADSGVVFIGDAAHAMPIFAGEGGNHGLLDGVELGTRLGDAIGAGTRLEAVVREWYEGVYSRWKEGIERSEQRLGGLHKSMKEWEGMAAMMNKKKNRAGTE